MPMFWTYTLAVACSISGREEACDRHYCLDRNKQASKHTKQQYRTLSCLEVLGCSICDAIDAEQA